MAVFDIFFFVELLPGIIFFAAFTKTKKPIPLKG